MAFKFSARTWHNWVSFVLVIPILIVSITAVLIAHDKRLGLKEIDITRLVGWLPGYGTSAMKQEKMEIRATLSEEDGSRWVGTKMGLYKYEQEKLLPIPELSGIEVRDLLAAPWGVIAATKNGVWLLQNNQWQNVYKGDAWNASLTGENVMVSIKDRGLIYSNNGINWQPEQETQQALMNVPMQDMDNERVTISKLVIDMHTGKAFLGKQWEWIWIDLIGLVLVFLSATGIFLWWRGEKRKRAMADSVAP